MGRRGRGEGLGGEGGLIGIDGVGEWRWRRMYTMVRSISRWSDY